MIIQVDILPSQYLLILNINMCLMRETTKNTNKTKQNNTLQNTTILLIVSLLHQHVQLNCFFVKFKYTEDSCYKPANYSYEQLYTRMHNAINNTGIATIFYLCVQDQDNVQN